MEDLAKMRVLVLVATPSIRWRILKARTPGPSPSSWPRRDPLDPLEDTESCRLSLRELLTAVVATPSIRWRILKDRTLGLTLTNWSSRDPLDPLEDTER